MERERERDDSKALLHTLKRRHAKMGKETPIDRGVRE
jgi:hypothetical protein